MTDAAQIDPVPRGDQPARPPLPAALQSWARWLDWLAPDQQQAVGDLLRRLHPALGAYRGPVQRGGDSVAGVDELRRRGPYHRLLLSEWAVADAASEEFLRRASSGEHLFLSPRHETPRADAGIVAVFDGGPSQLGAPRLAQVALWILLAQRAEAAGVGFAWGALDAPGALHPADSVEALRRFLAGRTFTRPAADLRDRWHASLIAAEIAHGERWLVGGEDDPRFSHRVRLQRDLAGQLRMTIDSPAGRRGLDVLLPSAAPAQRLLRGEFGYVAKPQRLPEAVAGRLSLQQPPLIGHDKRRIAVPLVDGRQLMIRTLPSRSSYSKKKAVRDILGQRCPEGQQVLCMTMSGKKVAGLLASDMHLHFWPHRHFRSGPRPPADRFSLPIGQPRWLPCEWFNSGGEAQHFYVVDRNHQLLSWTSETRDDGKQRDGEPALIDTTVLAIARIDDHRLLYLRHQGVRATLYLLERGNAVGIMLMTCPRTSPPGGTTRGLLAYGAFDGSDHRAVAAHPVSAEAGAWQVWSAAVPARHGTRAPDVRSEQIRVGEGWKVHGLCLMPGSWTAALVAVSPDRRRLCAIGPSTVEVLYASEAPITTVSTSVDGTLIALVTERRTLVVLHPEGNDDARVPDSGQGMR